MDTVLECLRDKAESAPNAKAIFTHSPESGWSGVSWKSVCDTVIVLSNVLTERGVKPGDRLAIIAPNGLKWELAHFAALAAGAVVVGLDAHDTPERLQKILRHASVTALVIDSDKILAKLGNAIENAKIILSLSPSAQLRSNPAYVFWDAAIPAKSIAAKGALRLPLRAAPATIIYTSGTTGDPKGILYTHGQLALACETILAALPPPRSGARFVCWLPLSNLFQRVMNLCGIASGASLYMVADPLRVLEFVAEIQPDVFIGVPRFYEKLALGIKSKLAAEQGLKRFLAQYALNIGQCYADLKRSGKEPGMALTLQYKLADRLVLRRLRALMGSRLQYMISGSAPIPKWILEYFQSFGWLLLEAYGLSENMLPIAMNTPNAYRFGSVGRVLPGNELQFADDGELLVRGPGLFDGYLGVPGSFANAIEGGFYRTGDIGKVDESGFLSLTGRKSEIIKTTAGRRIALPVVEAVLRELPWVDHAVVFGSGRKCLTAILTRAPGGAEKSDEAALSSALAAHIDARLAAHERPAAFTLLPRAFSVDGGELTPNLKLRRIEIERKYKAVIENMFEKLDQPALQSSSTPILVEVHE